MVWADGSPIATGQMFTLIKSSSQRKVITVRSGTIEYHNLNIDVYGSITQEEILRNVALPVGLKEKRKSGFSQFIQGIEQ